MSRRFNVRAGAAIVALGGAAILYSPMVSAQTQTPAKTPPKASAPAKPAAPAAAKPWTLPKTPWGHPDLQGLWISIDNTPIEAPRKEDQAAMAALAKWFPGNDFTSAKVAQLEPKKVTRRPEDAGRTQLVTDPADGRLLIKAGAMAERDNKLNHLNDTYENQTLWERCIVKGPTLLPAPYDSGYRIAQTPDHVVILAELLHTVRIIPLDGSPHLGADNRSWNGNSRGHWEGNTLVVDTTNFRDKDILVAPATTTRRLRGLPHSEQLHIIERFTRVDADTIEYELTVSDPNVYDKAWTARMPLDRLPTYQMLESACHEGNDYLADSLRGARVEEKEAAEAAAKKPAQK
jgi:hypothetical protein